MNRKKPRLIGLLTITLLALIVIAQAVSAATDQKVQNGGRELTTDFPIIRRVSESFSNDSLTGVTTDFAVDAKFEVETKGGKIITAYWEHNGTYLHAMVISEVKGYVAIGWRQTIPVSGTTGSAMSTANIVIGNKYSNGTELVRDDFGVTGQHFADTATQGNGSSEILFSKAFKSDGVSVIEFVYPLVSHDTGKTAGGTVTDTNLTLGSHYYFLLSALDDENTDTPAGPLMTIHGDNRHIINKPVYIQQTTEEYPEALKDPKNYVTPYENEDLIAQLLALPGVMVENVGKVFGNLIAGGGLDEAVIPVTGMFFFLAITVGGVAYLIVYSRKQKWNLTSTLIPLMVIGLFVVGVFIFPLPRIIVYTDEDVKKGIDVQVVIAAQIKPWTFNATVYENKAWDKSITTFVDPVKAYAGDVSRNQLNSSYYTTDPQFSGLITLRIPVYTGQTIKFVLRALDTEHGFALGDETQPVLDYFGNKISYTLPQAKLVNIYYTAPSTPQLIPYRCTFFCGAGHFAMSWNLEVLAAPTP